MAAELNITENTVHSYLDRLRRKSGSHRRATSGPAHAALRPDW
ncbi:hypothetical protein [Streptomyces sp. NPDC057909]